jgi:hypothetical protein
MTKIKYYPVIDCNSDGTVKAALFPVYSEDIIRRCHGLWLTEVMPNRYSLRSTDKGRERLNDPFKLKCPKCSSVMRLIATGTSENRHGLYSCSSCDHT